MRLRDFQLYAPKSSRAVNVGLSVASELVVLMLRSASPIEAPFAKLVVSIFADDSWEGSEWILWSGGIGEFRVTEGRLRDDWDRDRDQSWTISHADDGLVRAAREGAAVQPETRSQILNELASGPPYSFEISTLAATDRKTGDRYRVVYAFDLSSSRVVLLRGTEEVAELARSPDFLPLDAIFPATKSRISGHSLVFTTRSRDELGSVSID